MKSTMSNLVHRTRCRIVDHHFRQGTTYHDSCRRNNSQSIQTGRQEFQQADRAFLRRVRDHVCGPDLRGFDLARNGVRRDRLDVGLSLSGGCQKFRGGTYRRAPHLIAINPANPGERSQPAAHVAAVDIETRTIWRRIPVLAHPKRTRGLGLEQHHSSICLLAARDAASRHQSYPR